MSQGSLVHRSKRMLRYTSAILPNVYCNVSCIRDTSSLLQGRRYASSTQQSVSSHIFPSTSFYSITPSTVCEVLSHDVKAASLTKALYIDCLPPSVSGKATTTEFHKTWKKAFLESFFFTPEHRKVPRTKNRKSNEVIMESLYSNLLKLLFAKVDTSVNKISVDRHPYFQHPFYRSFPDRDKPEAILVEGNLKYSILSNTPAAPLFPLEDCLQTRDHALQWDDVISPLLGYEQVSVPDNITPGESSASLPLHPYTRVLLDIGGGAEWSDNARARGIYFLFARLASEAVRDGYSAGEVLEQPRVGVYISGSAYSFHYVFYQLNTLDLMGQEGVKNLAWGASVDNTTSNLLPMKRVEPDNLLGPRVLEEVIDMVKTTMFYDMPIREGADVVYFE